MVSDIPANLETELLDDPAVVGEKLNEIINFLKEGEQEAEEQQTEAVIVRPITGTEPIIVSSGPEGTVISLQPQPRGAKMLPFVRVAKVQVQSNVTDLDSISIKLLDQDDAEYGDAITASGLYLTGDGSGSYVKPLQNETFLAGLARDGNWYIVPPWIEFGAGFVISSQTPVPNWKAGAPAAVGSAAGAAGTGTDILRGDSVRQLETLNPSPAGTYQFIKDITLDGSGMISDIDYWNFVVDAHGRVTAVNDI